MKISTILVPLDGSALAEAALVPAIELARERRAKLLLLRAAEAHTLPMADPTDAQVAAVREAEDYLAGMRDRARRASVGDVDASVWYGPPAQAIVEAAQYRKADLIVMSSHGRSGFGRLVLGSVAEKVLRSTAVPILLIRPGAAPLDTPIEGAPAAKEVARA
jgi:nucleotide-binding universal stress UspA family protein